MFSIFKRRAKKNLAPLITDIHSHLLPGLDDGVDSHEEALELIKEFHNLGYEKLIITPHIMSDFYRNEPAEIQNKLAELTQFVKEHELSIQLEAAAEYYLDEDLLAKVDQHKPLLTFGSNYLLFETNFLNEPYQLKEFIFAVTTQGYKPVLAHPERYQYLVSNFEKVEDLKNRGVLFQLNIPSIIGAYSRPIQKLAIALIEKGWVDFLGSDCHNQFHMNMVKDAYRNKYFEKALELPLLNRNL